ncbi:TPA: hypothetical protein EYP83_01425, partial [Candidatus Geothermarchaeota archaeon]|nr:hypothetical protein [Candidatus Geothermarchaeota archaeon]
MKIIQLYDEHTKVAPGWGSVANVILNLSRQMVSLGHDVTVIERKWMDTPSEEVLNGIKYKRFKLHIGSNIPGRDVPYQMIRSPKGFVKMILDRMEFSFKLNKYFRTIDFDILHVHVPFVANIL